MRGFIKKILELSFLQLVAAALINYLIAALWCLWFGRFGWGSFWMGCFLTGLAVGDALKRKR